MTNISSVDSPGNGDSTEIWCYFCLELLWPLFFFNLNTAGRKKEGTMDSKTARDEKNCHYLQFVGTLYSLDEIICVL